MEKEISTRQFPIFHDVTFAVILKAALFVALKETGF
jgi:hypothetical protein